MSGVTPLPIMGMGKWGRGSDAGCRQIRAATGQQEGRWTERSWALGVPPGVTCSGAWDTALGDTMGQAHPDNLVCSDSSQKIRSRNKQNCMDKVSVLMLDSKLLRSPDGAEGPHLRYKTPWWD